MIVCRCGLTFPTRAIKGAHARKSPGCRKTRDEELDHRRQHAEAKRRARGMKPRTYIASDFWAFADRTGGPFACWPWLASRDRAGYGRAIADGEISAHRAAWRRTRGPIPDGLTLDHLCRNPACVNPDHLEPVSRRTNSLRGISPAAVNARRTRCKWGHEFTPENTYLWTSSRGKVSRICRACRKAAAT